MHPLVALPIDPVLPAICAAVKRRGAVVVEASPGAGKTTRVPRALLEAGVEGEIVVLEPRRIAARLAAARVAAELGEPLGATVGYQVRFERKASTATRIRFVTEGILTRWLMRDPRLAGVGTVVLDELHERHLHTDVALALLARLRQTERPDLRIAAMSATLESEPVAALLGAETIRSEVRRYEVAVEHLAAPSREPLDVRVVASARRLLREGLRGHILVFLPGAADIRRAAARAEALARDFDLAILPLHGRLPASAQDAAVAPSERQKLVLATNVAESSLTIEGVEAVIDSGLAKVARTSPWSGLSRLEVERVSRASAAQRAGRAGRTRPGRCLRLYTEREHARMRAHDEPEILRADLCEAALALRLAGAEPAELRWLTAPDAQALGRAEALLDALGALEAGGRPSARGRRMARFPVHPRLSRALVEAEARGALDEVAGAAALLSEGGLESDETDLWAQLEALEESASPKARAIRRTRSELARLGRSAGAGDPDAAALSLLSGYPDRVARRAGDRGELALAGGGRAVRPRSARDEALVLLLEATERQNQPALARTVMPISPDWLLDLFADALEEREELVWNDDRERVERLSQLAYRGLVIEESRAAAPPSEQASAVLVAAARRARLAQRDPELERLLARAAFAVQSGADRLRLDPERALEALAVGRTSFSELGGQLAHALVASLDQDARRLLERLAPERVRLPGGRELEVRYPQEGDPYIESYLQDFFGAREGPRAGSTTLVMHLWAPNRRAVQVTRDLASFWDEHYPSLRRQLARRYPKHFWPDDPRLASAKRLRHR